MSSSPSSSFSSEVAAPGGLSSWVMDVPCAVDIVLGTVMVKVRECAQLETDAVVRLPQAAGADLEVRVAGVPVATGEVVIVDDTVALRINRILPPAGQELV